MSSARRAIETGISQIPVDLIAGICLGTSDWLLMQGDYFFFQYLGYFSAFANAARRYWPLLQNPCVQLVLERTFSISTQYYLFFY